MARQGVSVRKMALRMMTSLRIAAVSASFFGLPASTRRWKPGTPYEIHDLN